MFTPRLEEIYRYLGFRGADPPEEIKHRVKDCVARMLETITLRTTRRKFPVVVTDPDTVHIAGLTIRSKDLCRNLAGCDEAYMFAATVGIGIDRLIKRGEVSNMADALICQAAGAELIESYVTELNGDLRARERERGYKLRPRFSPGYGDLPIALQKDFSRILSLPRTCSITLTDTLLMVPSKSVTAFIGCTRESGYENEGDYLAAVVNPLTATGKSAKEAVGGDAVSEEDERTAKCHSCNKYDCEYRK